MSGGSSSTTASPKVGSRAPGRFYPSSGTLLNSTVFLTAGHCLYDVGMDGGYKGHSGGNDVWATFDEQLDLDGFPSRFDYDDPAELYEDRSEWLMTNPNYIRGTANPHPLYDNFASFPDTHDVGVVRLSKGAGDRVVRRAGRPGLSMTSSERARATTR